MTAHKSINIVCVRAFNYNVHIFVAVKYDFQSIGLERGRSVDRTDDKQPQFCCDEMLTCR